MNAWQYLNFGCVKCNIFLYFVPPPSLQSPYPRLRPSPRFQSRNAHGSLSSFVIVSHRMIFWFLATCLIYGYSSKSVYVLVFQHDWGGPFVCEDNRGAFTLLGVSSFTYGDDNKELLCTRYSVFQNVTAYHAWITATMRSNWTLFDSHAIDGCWIEIRKYNHYASYGKGGCIAFIFSSILKGVVALGIGGGGGGGGTTSIATVNDTKVNYLSVQRNRQRRILRFISMF